MMPGFVKNVGIGREEEVALGAEFAGDADQLGHRQPRRVPDRDDRALAAAGHQVDRHAGVVEHLEHAEMGQAERRAAAERQPDGRAEQLVRQPVDRQRRAPTAGARG